MLPGSKDPLFGASDNSPSPVTRRRYMVLSSPRSGSTMLCSALAASGLAGNPHEYLSPNSVARYRRRHGRWSIDDRLADIQREQTSPNGYFGIKMHSFHFRALFGDEVDQDRPGGRFLRTFEKFIVCFRRQKIDQVISNVLANERGVFASKGLDTPSFPARRFEPRDVETISVWIARMAAEERFWREAVGKLGLPAIEVAYEDIAADPAAKIASVFDFLEIPRPPEGVAVPTTRRLADSTNKDLKRSFLAAIGEGG